MRTLVGVALVIVCLGLTGCSLFGKKQAARKDNPRPFLGSKAPDKPDIASLPRDNSGPLPGANGLLAGQVIVEATERPIRAAILIRNLNREDAKGADIDISTDESGYFQIPKLTTGESYLLEARALENGQLISRRVYTKPPQPAMLIALDRRFTTASTPPPPDMPHLGGGKKATAGTDNLQEHKPTVSIDPPQTLPDAGPSGPGGIASPAPRPAPPSTPGGGPPVNPANIADSGFRRITPHQETVTIPSPPPPPPSQPQWDSVPDQRSPARTAPPVAPGSVRLPSIPTPVPSCVLLGNRLGNFALYDLNGEVWEYKRDRRRLVLLDFWRHNCSHCLQGIPKLNELQRDFGSYGLEVIGIACEAGPIEEQKKRVRATRGRYNMNYPTLLSGGPSCPVCQQFQVGPLPLLVLIDGDGTIIWRSPQEGMEEYAHYALRKKISDCLVTQQSQP